MNVFHLGVPDMVLSKAAGHVIITVEGGGIWLSKANAIEELVEEYHFIGCIVQYNIFGIAQGICNNFLLL
jgi:hypothetical protein